MSRTCLIFWIASFATAAFGSAAEPARVVFQNGRSILAASLVIQGDKLVVRTASDGFNPGQSFPLSTADHISGDRPAAINQAIALCLTGKPKEGRDLLRPVVDEQRITARIPGNFWLEAARALLVAHALNGSSAECATLGKEISDVTPAQGIDPFVSLGKALLLPPLSTRWQDREVALRDLTTDNLPAEVCSYAGFFRGHVFKEQGKQAEALEAFLGVPCLHPTGGLILNAASELQAAELLASQGRREEALAFVQSAGRVTHGTVLADEVAKRLESLK